MSSTESSAEQSGPANPEPGAPEGAGELASWGVRVCAKVIDSAIVWIPFTALWFVGTYFMNQGEVSFGQLFYALSAVEGVLGWGWIIYQVGTTGQSIGKRVMRTRIVDARTGRPIGFGHAFLHETVQLFVDMLPIFIGYLRPLVDAKRQTFSDKIMHTLTYRSGS